MKLSFVLVDNWLDACHLMHLRNACRDGFTHFTDEITHEMQHQFFHDELLTGKRAAYLLEDAREPIGFGMLSSGLSVTTPERWMTIGIAPERRHEGLSYVLTELITAMGHGAGCDVWLDVKERAPVREVYRRCGYEEQWSTSDGLVVMRNRQPRPPRDLHALRIGQEVKV